MSRAINLARKLRRTPTWAERALWRELRNRQFAAFKFRRQYPTGPYVLDFFCPSAKLAIELDGDPHGLLRQQAHDQVRRACLARERIRVLRFWNLEIKENLEGVLTTIQMELERNTAQNPRPDPLPWTTRERETAGMQLSPIQSPLPRSMGERIKVRGKSR